MNGGTPVRRFALPQWYACVARAESPERAAADGGPTRIGALAVWRPEQGCDIDLVLIATEGETAVDVFHLTRTGRKLDAGEERSLADRLQQLLEAHA